MGHRYDGRGGSLYDGESRSQKAEELRDLARQANETAATYAGIGYSGHAASARRQADILNVAAGKVERGEPISDHEQRGYNG